MSINLSNTSLFNSTSFSSDQFSASVLGQNFHDLFQFDPTLTGQQEPAVESIKNRIDSSDTSPFILSITILYSTLIITSLISNPLLIYVLLIKRKKKIKIVEIFVANLSLSDLLLTIFNIPLSLIIYSFDEWPFGSLLCKVATYSTSCSIYVNILTMTYISIDRYFAITSCQVRNPRSAVRTRSILTDGHTRNKIYTALTIIWIVALVLSLPQFLFTSVSKNTKKLPIVKDNISKRATETELFYDYKDDYEGMSEMDFQKELSEDPFKKCLLSYPIPNMKIYMTLVNFSFQYLIPLLVILYFYGKIIYHLYLNLNIAEFKESKLDLNDKTKHTSSAYDLLVGNNNDSHVVKTVGSTTNIAKQCTSRLRIEGCNRTKNLKKSIKVMIIIIALFLLSWLPIHLYRLVTTYVPLIRQYIAASSEASSADSSAFSDKNRTAQFQNELENCRKLNDKQCEDNVILREISMLKIPDSRKNASYHTLHNPYLFFISYFMSMSSVCYNPIVYFWMHKKFRVEVKQTFGRIFNLRFIFRKRTNQLFSSFRTNSSSKTTRSSLELVNLPTGSVRTSTSYKLYRSKMRGKSSKKQKENEPMLVKK